MSNGWQPGQPGGDEVNPFAHRDTPPQDPSWQPGYGAPQPNQPGAAQPQPGYGPPQPNQPQPGYGAPQPNQPAPGYGPAQGGPEWQPAPGAPRKKAKWPIFLVLGIVLVVLCGGGATGGYLLYRKFGTTHTSKGDVSAGAPAAAGGDGKGIQVGKAGASKKIEVYLDFGCPPCKSVHTAVQPAIDKAVAAGDTQVLLYPVGFTGEPAKRAANALACTSVAKATPSDVLKYEGSLFDHQPSDESSGFSADDLVGYAPAAVRDADAFAGCVRSDLYKSWVGSVGTAAQKRGITGVPTVFVNGKQLDQNDLTADAVTSALG
ncbi:DsbA family protein [Actinocatenispora rupis]|uniref:Thioredoxin-like fold domain-containing protein n=1 Tax=Actinocatenispora rupis TaxID=519421 RepID=A0A8J3IZU4_9ACTN|nr:thioredoxin domain-containing protein [Actinocatenispora rupis]GID13151.1 hypothetical protein Aru02nite_40400 [Actinocatenispora rupis]